MPSRMGSPIPRDKFIVSFYAYVAGGLALVSSVTALLHMHAWGMPLTLSVITAVLLALPNIWPRGREFVQVDEQGVSVATKRGIESVTWPLIERVRILTTSGGPFVEDVFFVLEASNGKGCVVPHAAAVRTKLLEELETRLPGVRDNKVIEAMGCASDNSFTIWEKPGANVA